ncbi:MAG: DMT family transporter [Nitrososphaeraceae archaeon]
MLQKRNIIIGYSTFLISAILWGSVSTIAKPTLNTIDPLLLSALVLIIAGLFFTPLTRRKSPIQKIPSKYYLLLFITALCGTVIGPFLFFIGLEKTTASDTSLLSNAESVFSIIIALLIFNERLNKSGVLAIILILSGVIILTTNLEFEDSLTFNYGNLFVIAATLFWGLDNNLTKIVIQHIDITRMVQLKSLIGGVILLIIAFFLRIPINIHYSEILPIVILGIFGFGVSLYFALQSVKQIGVIRSSLIPAFAALFGVIFATIFLNEQIGSYQIIAGIVMLGGIYLLYKNEKYLNKEES